MIQRIQTLYLLAAFVFQAVGTIYAPHVQYDQYAWISSFSYHFASAGLSILIVVTLFLYSKRPMQLQLCRLCLLGLCILFVLGIFGMIQEGFQFPREGLFGLDLGSILLVLLAFRAIQKDEALVRSVDRIR